MKKKTTADEFINWWLSKYHDTTVEEVFEKHSDWTHRDFYPTYEVTQEQHDEWYEWAISTVMREYRIGRKRAVKDFSFAYLNTAPNVKE